MGFSGRPGDLPHGPLCEECIAAVAAALCKVDAQYGVPCARFAFLSHICLSICRTSCCLLLLKLLFAGLQCNTRTADVDFLSLLKPTAIAFGRALRITWRCGVLAQNFPSSWSSMACHLM